MTDATTTLMTGADLPEQMPHVPEGFRVRDAATAAWMVRKIVEARAYGRRVREWAARELRRAEREEKFFLYRFGQQLEEWTRRRLELEGNRRRSVSLPSGIVGLRAEPPRLKVTDEDALLRWCRANLPAAVVTEQRVLKSVVTEHVAASGELPQGVEVSEAQERFFIK